MRAIHLGAGLKTCATIVAAALLVLVSPYSSLAQQPPAGVLRVTVVDATGAVIVGATVTATGIDPATKAVTAVPVQTSEQGIAVISRLVPGRYAVEAAFEGFETRQIPEVRVRNGDNRQVILLPIAGVTDTVAVGQGTQEAAADPRGPSFGTVLTREQLEALSDDPNVLRQQLQDMAGPGAVIKVDSFEGGGLPAKSQIRSIRISRDQFAAENHNAGGTQIEIITQPGQGPVRFNIGVRARADALAGRPVYAHARA